MQAASKGTYLSQKQMQAYTKKRAEVRASKQQAVSEDVIKPKAGNQDGVIKPKAQTDEQIMPKASAPMMKQAEMEQVIASFGNAKKEPMPVVEEDDDDDERARSLGECDSDELDGDLNLSDNEEEAANLRNNIREKKQAQERRVYRQEIDTNIFKLQFGTLADKAELATGDPIFCKKCQACFNIHSKTEEAKSAEGNEQQIWKCEFCNSANEVELEEEEKPQSNAVNYIVEAAAQVQDKKVLGQKEVSVVFCIDQSGSMCVSQPIKGKVQLKGDKTKDMRSLMSFSDGSDQFLQGERNVTYVSRMQCLQAAIASQISDMANGAADRKLGLVSFNHEVAIIGDGSEDPQMIAGDKLDNYDYLAENGAAQAKLRMKNTISQSHKKLAEKLMGLEETGPTALGPAVLSSIALASEGAPGSQVVICTDGLANVGLGAFDEAKTEEAMAKVNEFYERAGEFAKSKGLTINVVSIIGDECNLDSLSRLAELTGGNVERVDPVSLTKCFANSLAAPIIASNVVAKVKLHKGLQFRNELDQSLSEDKTIMTKDLGNVTAETEITFEYTLKAISELVAMEDIDLTQIKSFPFQTQITYKGLDGSKCVRVITELLKISNDRDELEKEANFGLLGQNAVQKGAFMAMHGQHREAQAYAKQWDRKMKSKAATAEQTEARMAYVGSMGAVYNQMGAQDAMESATREKTSTSKPATSFFGFGKKAKEQKSSAMPQRSSKMNDDFSANLFQAQKMNTKKMKKK